MNKTKSYQGVFCIILFSVIISQQTDCNKIIYRFISESKNDHSLFLSNHVVS